MKAFYFEPLFHAVLSAFRQALLNALCLRCVCAADALHVCSRPYFVLGCVTKPIRVRPPACAADITCATFS
jgi:hypothetical protein